MNTLYGFASVLNLKGKYIYMNLNNFNMTDQFGNIEKRPINETYNVTLKVFVTNDYTDLFETLDGILGIAHCPEGIRDNYSFAHGLLDYYKTNGFVKESARFFSSMEWDIPSPNDNSGDPYKPKGAIYFNKIDDISKGKSESDYIQIGKSINTFDYQSDIVDEKNPYMPKNGAIYSQNMKFGKIIENSQIAGVPIFNPEITEEEEND